jgi:hypothetical protein
MLESNSVNEQRTPDTLSTENELICKRLLGWTLCNHSDCDNGEHWISNPGQVTQRYATPSFATWGEAGLILQAMQREMKRPDILAELADGLAEGNLDTGSIRAAALEYIKATQATDLIMARGDGG